MSEAKRNRRRQFTLYRIQWSRHWIAYFARRCFDLYGRECGAETAMREALWWFLFKVDCFVPLVLCDWAIASPNNRDLELVMRTRKRRRKNGAAQVVVVPAIASSKNSRRCCWSPTRTNESGVRWTLLCLDGSVHSDEEWNGGKFVYHEIAIAIISCQFKTNDAGKWQHHKHNLYRPPAQHIAAKRKKWKRNLGQSAV